MEECIKTARKAAWYFYRRYKNSFHLDVDDVRSEAYVAMLHALDTHNPNRERGKQSWIGYCVLRHLRKTFLMKPFLPKTHIEDFDELISNKYNLERTLMILEALQDMSDLPKEMFEMVLSGKIDTKDDNKNTIKQELFRIFKERGFGIQKIKKAFHDLKTLATLPL